MTPNPSLTFHGAARATTGSRHLLTLNDQRVLLDCGLCQGRRKDSIAQNQHFGFDPTTVHSVLLSHAHIDHSGNLPGLVKQGFDGPIYATPATADLCRVMLRDSAHIQEKDAEWLTRRSKKHHREPRSYEPLYTAADAEACIGMFLGLPHQRTHPVLPDLRATFIDAGHILGSSAIVLDIGRGDAARRLAFSGDIGRGNHPLLPDPEIPADVDWLIMEGTYGARAQDTLSDAKAELRDTVARVVKRGGRIVVPSFSVERTQEIVYFLNELHNENALPPIPIFVDSPLAVNATDVFRLHAECFNERVQRTIVEDQDPFGFHRLSYVRSVEKSKEINTSRMPCVIISASGMCEAGRIRHHLRNNIGDPANAILFVGYQAAGTLGRRIVERAPEIKLFGETHRVRAEIITINSMSGHADRDGLLNYARAVAERGHLRKLFLVHGDADALDTLGARLRSELNLDVVIPELGDEHPLEM